MKKFLKAILKFIMVIVLFGLAAVGAVFLIFAIKNHFGLTYKMFAIYSGGGILMFLGVIKFIELLILGFKFIISSVIPSSTKSRAGSILNKGSDE